VDIRIRKINTLTNDSINAFSVSRKLVVSLHLTLRFVCGVISPVLYLSGSYFVSSCIRFFVSVCSRFRIYRQIFKFETV